MPQAKSQEWETPRDLFDALWERAGGYDCDPCCTPEQYTARRVLDNGGTICVPPTFSTLGGRVFIDGLTQPWHGRVFMNPPYGLALRKWVPKAVEEVRSGRVRSVDALLPAKTDTVWWQGYVARTIRDGQITGMAREAKGKYGGTATEIHFIKGRLRFGGAEQGATFPSAIVVWRR